MRFMRNVLAHVSRGDRWVVATAGSTVFTQPDADAAHQQLEEVAKAMQPGWSKAVEVFLAGEEEVLTYMVFPIKHWTHIYSTNPLEPPNREIKHRTDVADIFPCSAVVIHLLGSILIEAGGERQTWHRYFGQALTRKLQGSWRRLCQLWLLRADPRRRVLHR